MEYKGYPTLPNWKFIFAYMLFLLYIILYFTTKDFISSFLFVSIMGLIYGVAGYILSKKPIILNDDGIKIRKKLYRWENVKCIIVCPNKYIIIKIALPEKIGKYYKYRYIMTKSSNIAEYMIKYDENIIKLLNDKIKNKITYTDYWDLNRLIRSLK